MLERLNLFKFGIAVLGKNFDVIEANDYFNELVYHLFSTSSEFSKINCRFLFNILNLDTSRLKYNTNVSVKREVYGDLLDMEISTFGDVYVLYIRNLDTLKIGSYHQSLINEYHKDDIIFEYNSIDGSVCFKESIMSVNYHDCETIDDFMTNYIHEEDHSKIIDYISAEEKSKSLFCQVKVNTAPEIYTKHELIMCQGDNKFVHYGVIAMPSKYSDFNDDVVSSSSRDTLTGFSDRNGAIDYLNANKDKKLLICYVDLDNLKKVNDAYGFSKGDVVLSVIAKRLKSLRYDEYFISRHSGDEFIIIGEFNDPARVVAEKIRELIMKPIQIDDIIVQVTASIGFLTNLEQYSYEESLRKLGLAVTDAKKRGKNNVAEYRDVLLLEKMKQMNMEMEIKNAINNYEFYNVYQPLYDPKNKKVIGFESLIRWKKNGMVIGPNEFIPYAVNNSMILRLSELVIDSALKQIALLSNLDDYPYFVTINLTVFEMINYNLISILKTKLDKYKVAAERVVLELTEDVFYEDIGMLTEAMKKLKELGIRIAIDDFGKGFSSLSQIDKLPIDIIKIDMSFIRNLSSENFERSILPGIISIANTLDVLLIAEGVETQFQLEYLRNLEVDILQGFLVSKPIEPDTLINSFDVIIDSIAKL